MKTYFDIRYHSLAAIEEALSCMCSRYTGPEFTTIEQASKKGAHKVVRLDIHFREEQYNETGYRVGTGFYRVSFKVERESIFDRMNYPSELDPYVVCLSNFKISHIRFPRNERGYYKGDISEYLWQQTDSFVHQLRELAELEEATFDKETYTWTLGQVEYTSKVRG